MTSFPVCPLPRTASFALPFGTILSRFERSLTGFGLTLALAITATGTPQAQAAKVPTVPTAYSSAEAVAQPVDHSAASEQVYLYGQSPLPDQIGSAYIVLSVQGNQVTGGFYMPHSSFDCFQGQVEGNHLQLNVLNSYEQTPYAYAIALQSNAFVAMAGESVAPPLQLVGYYPLENLSSTDQHVLATCQALNPPQI